MTFRELMAMQHKYSVMQDQLNFQKVRYHSMQTGSDAKVRQKRHIENLERELDEFLDTEI
ncbi:hypothetical protein PP940_gp079 [Rhizobium phage RL2RES]|uniref:Uncharacterized protein n=1 Tax=Rhizobium phage RL2RES TaxID=103371 RepID=A0A6B9J1N8_9CAUD|nr:hypothetical protein PP940_gp079 [Rhizobium phage RL2RES]QGZ14349.1 hypothetical protein RL2RES_079 [Rhizobium phage RL2RES]